LLNLTINGIEAMTTISNRPREIHIRSQFDVEQRQVCISVEDTGIGVSTEAMARLFEPFFTTRTQGIGMGLSISRSIIEAHGGRLWAESKVDRGSIFQFSLPSANGAAA
ncbi:MAG: ATP-binding protein, partial [Terriglobia bacterium]